MLNPKFLNEGWGEYTRGKGTTKDIIKLIVETTDTHILKFEVGRNNCIRSSSGRRMRPDRSLNIDYLPLRARLDLHRTTTLFHDGDVRLLHHHTHFDAAWIVSPTTSLLVCKLECGHGSDDKLQLVTLEVHGEDPLGCEDEPTARIE